MSDLTILIGLPGAGKSAWGRHHSNGALVVSSDALRRELLGAEAEQRRRRAREPLSPEAAALLAERRDELVATAIAQGQSVIVEDGRSAKHRQRYIAAAKAAGYRVHAVLFDNHDQAQERNQERALPTGGTDGPGQWEALLEQMERHKVAVAHEGYDSILTVSSYELLSTDRGGCPKDRLGEAVPTL